MLDDRRDSVPPSAATGASAAAIQPARATVPDRTSDGHALALDRPDPDAKREIADFPKDPQGAADKSTMTPAPDLAGGRRAGNGVRIPAKKTQAVHPARGSPVTPPLPSPPVEHVDALPATKQAPVAPAATSAPEKALLAVGPVSATLLVRAHTAYGEAVVASTPSGASTELRCLQDGLWTGSASFAADEEHNLTFGIARDGQPAWHPGMRSIPLPPAARRGPVLVLEDAQQETADAVFDTSAFADVIFRRPATESRADCLEARSKAVADAADAAGVATVFAVRAPRVAADHAVYIVGDCPALGAGRDEDALRLSDADAPVWSVCVPIPPKDFGPTIHYRFLIKDAAGKIVMAEDATHLLCLSEEMGRAQLPETPAGSAHVVVSYANAGFRYRTHWRGAGVALPVFSIRSADSCGVGEFKDLPRVVDFCAATGHQLLQLLPVNDTTSYNNWRDSYPYSAVSCFALHPQYINIEQLGELPGDMQEEYDRECKRLNALPEIDYEEVMRVKLSFIRRMYALQKEVFFQDADFLAWFKEQQHWLVPYALFRFFMEVNGSAKFDQWGARSSITPELMEKLAAPDTFHFDYLGVAYYTQYHLHNQLSAAAAYAASKSVVFKGDLPIGVNRYCADTWLNPHLFHLDMQAGAPPDFFSLAGQNWGFPTYNWDAMSADGFTWWRERLTHMANYFHAYRIDHILGFFRIWEIPASFRTGMSGRFRPVHKLRREELEARGLWDLDRLSNPYAHDGLLASEIGGGWEGVRDRFFEHCHGRLRFRDAFDTEVKIEAELTLDDDAPEHERERNTRVQEVLFGLMNNVCLLRDVDDGDAFHPRFLMERTSSFNELGDEWKGSLKELYQDYFFDRQNDLWQKSAMRKLPMMKNASRMLVCGEDLGFVPKCVPGVMQDTSILSLAVQRMPEGDAEFGVPSEYKYECVASTSSHDVSTFRGWWESLDGGIRQRYWNNILHRHGGAPEGCSGEIVEAVLRQHLASPAMWIITPIQDLLGVDESIRRPVASDEQINDPANPQHYWRFRLHVDMDQVMAKKELVQKLFEMNSAHRRGQAY